MLAAAITTFAAYLANFLIQRRLSMRYLRLELPYRNLKNVLVASSLMYAGVSLAARNMLNQTSPKLITLAILSLFGFSIYIAALFLMGQFRDLGLRLVKSVSDGCDLHKKIDTEFNEALVNYLQNSDDFLGILSRLDISYYHEYINIVTNFFDRDLSVLELGCGHGQGTWLLGDYFKKVCGVDISPKFVTYAQKHFSKDNIKFCVADATHLPFKDASFDAVISYSVIEFITDAEKALGEMVRMLKRGGTTIVMSPNLLSPFYALNGFLGQDIWHQLLFNLHASWVKMKGIETNFLYRQPTSASRVNMENATRVYLSNPWDVRHFFLSNGLKLLKCQRRSPKARLAKLLLGDLSPGFLVAARKS